MCLSYVDHLKIMVIEQKIKSKKQNNSLRYKISILVLLKGKKTVENRWCLDMSFINLFSYHFWDMMDQNVFVGFPVSYNTLQYIIIYIIYIYII